MSTKLAALTTKLMGVPLGELEGQWTQLLAQHGDRFVTWASLNFVLAEERSAAHQRQTALENRVAALETALAALQQRPADTFHDAGVHREGATYAKGALVTRRGYWLCLSDTTTVPGNSRDWRLVVKESR